MTSFSAIGYRLRLRFDAMSGRLERAGRALGAVVDWRDWRADRPTVLCLRRSTFIKDVDELGRREAFNLAMVSAAKIKRIQAKWVAPAYRRQTYFYGFLQSELASDEKYLERFALSFLQAAIRKHPIDAVLAGNTDYWQDEAVKLACHKLKIPFLVLGDRKSVV